jgi:hypothetical protein
VGELPLSDPAVRHPLLRHAAAQFGAVVAHVRSRQIIERVQRLLAENARLREIAFDLLDARLVRDPGAN